MATTVLDILLGAYGKSLKNQPSYIASEDTELTQVVYRALRGLFAAGARVNPYFYGAATSVTYSAPGWPRPATSELVYRLESFTGVEVLIVPFEDRAAEPGFPTVYEFGQNYIPTLIGPAIGFSPMKIFGSKRPSALTASGNTIDPMWPEDFNELLVNETAMYLALKDNRQDEIAVLRPERDRWADLYFAFLEHETIGERRRFSAMQFNTRSVLPARSLLAGNGVQARAA